MKQPAQASRYPQLPPELWQAKFASLLMHEQPRFPPNIAADVAAIAYPKLFLLKPRDALATFLLTMQWKLPGDEPVD